MARRLDLTCELCKINKVEQVLQLWLKGSAWESYQQLSKEQWNDIEEIKHAFIKAYETDSFVGFDQFTIWCLCPEETVDEFLTDLQWLVECWIKSTFISYVRGLLRLSTRIETLTLRELLERAHAVLVDTKEEHLAAAARTKQASPTLDLCETEWS